MTRTDSAARPCVLVPTDFSERAHHAFASALALARRLGADVVLLHVLTPLETDLWGPAGDGADAAHEGRAPATIRGLLDDMLAEHDASGVNVTLKTRRGGVAAPAIVACAEACGAGLVVMGTHGRSGLGRVLLGSVAEEVVRTAPCPVLLVREGAARTGATSVRRILVPLDHTPASREALPWAERLARAWDARLLLLHVLDVFPTAGPYGAFSAGVGDVAAEAAALMKEELQALGARIAASGPAVSPHVEIGSPPAGIVNFAHTHDVDLVVMTSHGRTGLSRLVLGSVMEKVLRAAPCPVLIVRTARGAAADAAHRETTAGEDAR